LFVGQYSPVPLGDYVAGSNHVLPTGGTARFSAGLSTHTFLRPVNLIDYDHAGLRSVAEHVIAF
ncbi:histidinol dehydrogenase, partial [Corynebacterium propinquum]|uniref:histidinol dehydrogenase n=1 Tax=Corynebacterium propinquum TaxID=43769 RepID=UPI000FA72DC8